MVDKNPYAGDSIFWVEVDRISPNPFQPRKTFDENALASLAESIRQYGVLQPLTVTRREREVPGEGIRVDYELVAGERRLRASKLAGVREVPVVIRTGEDDSRLKLELAIIENLQREDLNPLDRALAFKQLADEFGLKHVDIGKRMGKSREYVSNTLRILALPQEMQEALAGGRINEGHTRPLLMLAQKPDEQRTLFVEITDKHLTVRDAEQLARRVAIDRTRKDDLTPELLNLEREFTEKLGTRVRIERKDKGNGGRVLIEFFSPGDLEAIRQALVAQEQAIAAIKTIVPPVLAAQTVPGDEAAGMSETAEIVSGASPVPPRDDTDDLYSISGFTV